MTEQRRRYSRVLFTAQATLACGDRAFACSLLDISFKGALLAPGEDCVTAIGEACMLRLQLAEGDIEISMEGRVAHREGDHLGLRCERIDIDSLTHLRRLVELNVGDEAVLQRELSALTAA